MDGMAEAEAAMLGMSTTDNEVMKKSEAFLQKLLLKKAAAPTFYLLMQNSAHESVRQLSAVLLRPKIIAFYNRLQPAQREELKGTLIQRTTVEASRPVRKSLVSLMAALGKALVPEGQWPQLMQLMLLCASNSSEEARELAFILLKELLEAVGVRAEKFGPDLKAVFAAGLADSNVKVQKACLKALGIFLCLVDDRKKYQMPYAELMPTVLKMTEGLLVSDESAAVEFLDVLHELLESTAPILKAYSQPIMQLSIAVLAADSMEDSTKDMAATMLHQLIMARPKLCVKMGLVETVRGGGRKGGNGGRGRREGQGGRVPSHCKSTIMKLCPLISPPSPFFSAHLPCRFCLCWCPCCCSMTPRRRMRGCWRPVKME